MKQWVLILSLFFAQHAFAESFYVHKTTGTGAEQSDRDSVTELIKVTLGEMKGHSVTGKKSAANFELHPKLLKLGDSYILSITKTKKGTDVYASKLKSKTLSDMDTVSSRLLRAVIEEKSASDNARVSDVTDEEINKGTKRKEATNQWFFGFGPAWLSNLDTSNSGIFYKFGYNWGIDYKYDLKLSLSGVTIKDQSEAGFSNTAIGVNYYFKDRDYSPYVSGEFGYGSASTPYRVGFSQQEASGFIVSVGGGIKFFRTSSVNLGLEARYSHMFDKTSFGNPSQTTISIAVFW